MHYASVCQLIFVFQHGKDQISDALELPILAGNVPGAAGALGAGHDPAVTPAEPCWAAPASPTCSLPTLVPATTGSSTAAEQHV